MSFLKNCLAGLLLLTACVAFGGTHTVGNYRIEAGANGSYALYYHEQLIGRQSSFLAQDTQWKHLFSLATAAAEFTETADHGKAVLTWRVLRTEALEDFSQTLTLTSDGLEWRIAAKPVVDIFDATTSFLIPSELGAGAQYCVVKGNGSRSYLKFPKEPPTKADINLPGTTGAGQYFIRTSAGVIHLTFTPSNASAGDFRSNAKMPYLAFTSWSRNIKSGQQLERALKIRVLPENGFPDRDAKLETTRISNTAISNSELRGDYIAAKLHWQPGTLERLIFLPDDAELTRNVNSSDNYGGKLKWKPWKSPEVKLRATETNTVTASRTESDFRLIENYSLKPEESALRIRAEFTNLAAARQQDTPEFSVMIIPGRREREYNPDAFAVFLGEEAAPETLRIISCWGEYRRNQVSAVALCDREMRSVFVLNFPDRARRADAVTLKIGSQDSHAGRDMGKRSSLIWTYPDFDLPAGESANYHHDFLLFKGLGGISALDGDFALEAALTTARVAPGRTVNCRLAGAACAPVDRNILVEWQLCRENGSPVKDGRETLNYRLEAAAAMERTLSFSLPAETGANYRLNLIFKNENREFGRAVLPISTSGPFTEELATRCQETMRMVELEMARLPDPGTTTPRSLTYSVRAKFQLETARRHLVFDELEQCGQNLARAEALAAELKSVVTAELADPVRGRLRKLADIRPTDRIQIDGDQFHTPEGIRVMMQGACDADQFLKLRNFFRSVIDPKDELVLNDPEKNLRNPRLRRLAIDSMIRSIRKFGNAHSQYLLLKEMENPLYSDFVYEFLKELDAQGIWIFCYVLMEGEAFSQPERMAECLRQTEAFLTRIKSLKHFVISIVPGPEPPLPKLTCSEEQMKDFRDWHIRKYGTAPKLADAEIARIVKQDDTYSPEKTAFAAYFSDQLITATEQLLEVHRRIDGNYLLSLGCSAYTCWPLIVTDYFSKYASDPRLAAFLMDTYLGGWWGAEARPPELAWAGDLFRVSTKPLILGEWGSGASMRTENCWIHAFESLRQSFGRNYYAHGAKAMFAWTGGWVSYAGMFQFPDIPHPVTEEFCRQRDAIIASPIPRRNPVLSIAAQKGTPKYIHIPQIRLAAFAPIAGTGFDMADPGNVKNLDLSQYKLLIVHTEGVDAAFIASLRDFPGKVLLLGRPATIPGKGDAKAWVEHGLFLKDPRARVSGGGASRSLRLNWHEPFGNLKRDDSLEHHFAATRSAWITASQLREEVTTIASAGRFSVLMRQGNLYWFTDMLGSGNLDMPASKSEIYPRLAHSEQQIVSAMMHEAGIPHDLDELKVTVVNDTAVSYHALSGNVAFHNADAFTLPDGMFPRAYEAFEDGVVLLTGGQRLQDNNPIKIRCSADRVAKVTVDGRETAFRRLDRKYIEINLAGKGYAVCHICVQY